MKQSILLNSFALLFTITCHAQSNSETLTFDDDITVTQATKFSISPPLRDILNGKTASDDDKQIKSGHQRFPRNEHVNNNSLPEGEDPVWQQNTGNRKTSSVKNLFDWEGLTGGNPPDPTGAAGPNHFVQAVNVVFGVFGKDGSVLKQ